MDKLNMWGLIELVSECTFLTCAQSSQECQSCRQSRL